MCTIYVRVAALRAVVCPPLVWKKVCRKDDCNVKMIFPRLGTPR